MTTDPRQNALLDAIEGTDSDIVAAVHANATEANLALSQCNLLDEEFNRATKAREQQADFALSIFTLLSITKAVRQNIWQAEHPGALLTYNMVTPSREWVARSMQLAGAIEGAKQAAESFIDDLSGVATPATVQQWHTPTWFDMLIEFATETDRLLQRASEPTALDVAHKDWREGDICWWNYRYVFQTARRTTDATWNQIAWGIQHELQRLFAIREHRRWKRIAATNGNARLVAENPDSTEIINSILAETAAALGPLAPEPVSQSPQSTTIPSDEVAASIMDCFLANPDLLATPIAKRVVALQKVGKSAISKKEKEEVVRRYIRDHRDVEDSGSGINIADIVAATGFSQGWVQKCVPWRVLMDLRKQRKSGEPQKSRPAQSLTPIVEEDLGDKDEALQALIEDHRSDYEPSPFDDSSPKRVKAHKKA